MATFVASTIELTGGTLRCNPPNAFTDDSGSVHEPSINQLAALEMVRGIGDSEYGPARTVTRGQMGTCLAPMPAKLVEDGHAP